MKKLFSILLCATIAICCLCVCACDNPIPKNTTNVDEQYQMLMQNYGDNGYLLLSVDTSKVVPSSADVEHDKSYVFENVFKKYLDCSSGFFLYIAKRDGGASQVINKYASSKATELQSLFAECTSAVIHFAQEKQIFEQSAGALHYVETVEAMNVVIDKFYLLNTVFADEYFKVKGFRFEGQTDLVDCATAVNDIFWYELCALSRISFGYELVLFANTNPLGDTTEWFDSTQTVKNVCEIANNMLPKLKAHDDITLYLNATGREQILQCLKNIESLRTNFVVEYNSFLEAKHLVDLKTYLSLSTQMQREEYLETLPNIQKSRFLIVNNFMQGKYVALENVMKLIGLYVAG